MLSQGKKEYRQKGEAGRAGRGPLNMSVTPQSLTRMSKMGWELEGDQDSDAEQAEERWCAGVEVRQRMGSKEG